MWATQWAWHSGNTGFLLLSKNMTAPDAPDGRPGKYLWKGTIKVKFYEASEKPGMCWWISRCHYTKLKVQPHHRPPSALWQESQEKWAWMMNYTTSTKYILYIFTWQYLLTTLQKISNYQIMRTSWVPISL